MSDRGVPSLAMREVRVAATATLPRCKHPKTSSIFLRTSCVGNNEGFTRGCRSSVHGEETKSVIEQWCLLDRVLKLPRESLTAFEKSLIVQSIKSGVLFNVFENSL